jgi:Uma2 family endonuclease
MGDAAEARRMTAGEYLVWERSQASKHEFHHGEVFAMVGGSPRHNALATGVAAELRDAMRRAGKRCHVLSSDQRISLNEGERYVYADAVVVCGGAEMEAGTTDVLANPSVVVEVLSKRTEAYDRGDKWAGYLRLASVTDYVLVAQSVARVEHYRREADGSWRYRVLGTNNTLELANGGLVPVGAIYEGVFDLEGN